MTTIAPPRPIQGDRRTGGWALVAAQGGYALWFAGCAVWALARYDRHREVTSTGLAWLVAATSGMGMLFAGISLIASGWLLVFGYTRGHRRLKVALIVSGLAALATVVAALSPLGQSVYWWLLD